MGKNTYVLVNDVWEPIIGGGSPGPPGPTGPIGPGGNPKGNTVFSITGPVGIGIGFSRWYTPSDTDITLTSVRASVGTAPVGASLIVNLLRNGSSIATCNIPSASYSSGRISISQTLLVNQYLTVNISQVGSTVAGSDLVVQIEY